MWGACVFSMIVFTFQKMFQLNQQQRLAFTSIKQTRASARVIVASLTYQVYKKKYGNHSLQANNQMEIVKEKVKIFINTMKKLKKIDTYVEEIDQMNKFRNVIKEVDEFDSNINKLLIKYAS